jgi:hypothetical protein
MQSATSYSLESMMHQIMDQLATMGDILLEGEETCWQFYPSLVSTNGSASHQKPHLDFPQADRMKMGRVPFILHLPLCEEGLALQIWSTWEENETRHILPKLIFVPFCSALLLRTSNNLFCSENPAPNRSASCHSRTTSQSQAACTWWVSLESPGSHFSRKHPCPCAVPCYWYLIRNQVHLAAKTQSSPKKHSRSTWTRA